MLLSGTPLIFDPWGSEHKMSTCWTPPILELGLVHPWSSMPQEDLQRPLSLKTTWKPGWNSTNTWACWDRGQWAGTSYPQPPPPTSTSWMPVHTKAQRKKLSLHFKLWRKLHFLPCSIDHKQWVFYCRGLNEQQVSPGRQTAALLNYIIIKTGQKPENNVNSQCYSRFVSAESRAKMQTHSCHHAKPCGERKECFGDNKLQAPTQYSGNLNTTQGT